MISLPQELEKAHEAGYFSSLFIKTSISKHLERWATDNFRGAPKIGYENEIPRK